jgi:hypothetical protein
MRVALRTSGGRGEYELAGRQGNIVASELYGKNLFYELTPEIVMPGRAAAVHVQGKPRIRLADMVTTTHLYRLIAAVLLLPKPKREFKETGGEELIKRECYSITAIKIDIGKVEKDSVLIRPTDLLLENYDNKKDKVEFALRMARIIRLWKKAEEDGEKSPLSQLFLFHKKAVLAKNPNHKEIEGYADLIAKHLNIDMDVLPSVEKYYGLQDISKETPPDIPLEETFREDDDTTQEEARIERIKQWRQIAVRGAEGARFRKRITEIYDYRCIVSGERMPRLECTETAGVDAAHILPWSTYNINSMRNGLCLSKLCHWAFDEGVIQLKYDMTENVYLVEVPKVVRDAAKKSLFDLDYFNSLEGVIKESRLPRNRKFRPDPKYLDELDAYLMSR